MHASTAIELNPQVFACATLHAKSWCLFVCHLYTLPGKEGPGSTTPALLGCGSASGLLLATAWPGPNSCFEPLVFTTVPATPAPPVCYLEVGSGTRELAKLSADKACVVIGVLGG